MSTESLDILINNLLDDSLTDGQLIQLEQLLRNDPSARRRYMDLCELDSILEESAEEASFIRPKNLIPINAFISKQRRRILIGAIAAAILVTLSILSILLLIPTTSPENTLVKASPHSIFTTTHPQNSKISSSTSKLVPGSTLTLTQGSIELTFPTGVKSILLAPASIKLSKSDHLTLNEGRAWFHVPATATGFRVTTTDLLIRDIGTEFGIIADRGIRRAPDQIHVLKGLVEVANATKPEITVTLSEGKSLAHLHNGDLRAIPSDPSLFLESLPEDLPSLTWKFDQPSPFSISGSSPLTSSITTNATGKNIKIEPGKRGSSIQFLKNGAHLQTNWPGTDSDRPRTIACWIKCPTESDSGSIVEWGIPLADSAKWRITLNPNIYGEGGTEGALRTEFGLGYVIGTTDLRDNRWHHIVSVYDGSGRGNPESIHLYIDGKREAISSYKENVINTRTDNQQSQPCQIGKGFTGSIDELSIYEGTLTQPSIRNLLEQKN